MNVSMCVYVWWYDTFCTATWIDATRLGWWPAGCELSILGKQRPQRARPLTTTGATLTKKPLVLRATTGIGIKVRWVAVSGRVERRKQGSEQCFETLSNIDVYRLVGAITTHHWTPWRRVRVRSRIVVSYQLCWTTHQVYQTRHVWVIALVLGKSALLTTWTTVEVVLWQCGITTQVGPRASHLPIGRCTSNPGKGHRGSAIQSSMIGGHLSNALTIGARGPSILWLVVRGAWGATPGSGIVLDTVAPQCHPLDFFMGNVQSRYTRVLE